MSAADTQADAEQARADRLYPSTAPRQPPKTVPAAGPSASASPPPQTPDQVRDEVGGRLFGGAAYTFDLPDGAIEGADMPAWRDTARAWEASSDEATSFLALARKHAAEPPSPEQSDAWLRESKQLMKVKDYSQADLAAAQKLLRRDPKVFAAVDRLGLGNHPQLVDKLVLQARRERIAGRLA